MYTHQATDQWLRGRNSQTRKVTRVLFLDHGIYNVSVTCFLSTRSCTSPVNHRHDPALSCIKNDILIGNMLLLKNLNDAQLASLNILRNSRWRPIWPPFHNFRIVSLIIVHVYTKYYIFQNKTINRSYP